MGKYKQFIRKLKLKYQLPRGMKNFNYLMVHILYQIFKTILSILSKNAFTDNPLIKIYINKIENRITFKIKKGNYPQLLMPQTMKLLESTKNNITKDENSRNVSNLEISEVLLVNCNIANNNYQHDLRVLYAFVPNK